MKKNIKLSQKVLYRIKQIFSEFCHKFRKNDSKNLDEEKALVIDACFLMAINAIILIESYSRVIVLRVTFDEIDRKKTQIENARILLSKISHDRKDNQIQIANWYCKNKYVYVDNSIIDFCKNKNVILFTGDYGLASRAKGYNIEYILTDEVNNELESITEKEKLKKEAQEEIKENEVYISADVEDLKRKIGLNSFAETNEAKETHNQTIRNASMVGKDLILKIPNTNNIKYIVIKDGNIKKAIANGNMIKLQKEDIVIILTYKYFEKYLQLLAFRVTEIKNNEHAEFVGKKKLKCFKDIEELEISEEIKREIRNYFVLTNLN